MTIVPIDVGCLRPGDGGFPYRRIFASGGQVEGLNFHNRTDYGLFISGSKADFIACYLSAVALVNSIDINTVPFGKVRYFDYGGRTEDKENNSYIDRGNVDNSPLIIPGPNEMPAGTGDGGIILTGGAELSYMGAPTVTSGTNPGGYMEATWSPGPPGLRGSTFVVSRIQVAVCQCQKWSLVWWYPPGFPVSGFYSIQCQSDSLSGPSGAISVDIPDPTADAFWSPYGDVDLPCSAQYFVPGFECGDLI